MLTTVSYQGLADPVATHFITECDNTDTCPGCGAGYRVGMSACEYCRRPVQGLGLALLQQGEAIIPAGIEGWGLGTSEGFGYANGGGTRC